MKCASGRLRCFLIHHAEDVCGAVGVMRCGPVMRIKNFVIHPDIQRRGFGREVLWELLRMARDSGTEAAGVFGIAGGDGSALYQREGFVAAVRQIEWTKILTTNAS
jgi:GNAT superfamily N-acetyltransferase